MDADRQLFICFSAASAARRRTYMSEDLILALENCAFATEAERGFSHRAAVR